MKKMNMYEAPVAEMIEIEAVSYMMTITSQTGNGGGQGSNTGGGQGNPSF